MLKVGEDGCEVAGLLDGGPCRHTDRCAHLPGDHMRQGRLAQSRGPIQQDMIESLSAPARSLHENREVGLDLFLPHVFLQVVRA